MIGCGSGQGHAGGNRDQIVQHLAAEAAMLDAHDGDERGRHDAEEQHVQRKARRHQVSCFGRIGLRRVTDHFRVDDDAELIHEPGGRRTREDKEDEDRFRQVFDGDGNARGAEKTAMPKPSTTTASGWSDM